MCGYLEGVDLCVVGMFVRVKAVGKQLNNAAAAVLAGGQADVVNDNQADPCIGYGAYIPCACMLGAIVKIWRRDELCPPYWPGGRLML